MVLAVVVKVQALGSAEIGIIEKVGKIRWTR